MANFDLSALALKAVCPSNEILYDDQGMPSVMVKIPKMTYAQLGLGTSTATHPAFIVNGTEVDAIYISKYQNIRMNGRAYSLPGQNVAQNINLDNARAACEAKGAGWHLMTAVEWAAIALWCKNNGTMPYGNNNYGKDSRESNYKAIPDNTDSTHYALRVKSGTGPLTWSHDRTPDGIWDLNGNVNEWLDGLRLVYGELQVLVNNNAADSDNPKTAASTLWMAISASDGSYITPDGSGTTSGSIKLRWDTNHFKWTSSATADGTTTYKSCAFEAVVCDSTIDDSAKLILQALALMPYDTTSGAYEGDQLYANTIEAERAFSRGGSYNDSAAAGVFRGVLLNARSGTHGTLGFRSAFVQLPAA